MSLRPTLPTRGDVAIHLERWCRGMCESPVTFIVVAHELLVDPEGPAPAYVVPHTGTSKPTLPQKLAGMVDVVGYTARVEDDQGNEKYMAQLVPANGRIAGDRFTCLGKTREIDLTEWIGAITESDNTSAAKTPQEAATA